MLRENATASAEAPADFISAKKQDSRCGGAGSHLARIAATTSGDGFQTAASVMWELEADVVLVGACARTAAQLNAVTSEKSAISERRRGAVFMIFQDCCEAEKQKTQKELAAVRDAAA